MTSTVTAFKRFVSPLLLAALASVALPAAAQNLNWGTGNKTETEKLQFGTRSSSTVTLGALSVTTSTAANSFWVYCLDPLNSASLPSAYTTVSLQNFITNTAAGSASYTTLFGATPYTDSNVKTTSADTGYRMRNTTQVYSNLVELYSHAYADSLLSVKKSAAFQYAVWTILGEDELRYSSSTGGLKDTDTDTAFRTQADAYLTAITSNNWGSVNGANLSAMTSYSYQVFAASPLGGSQTFLAVTKTSGGTVAEPGSLALASLAAAGVLITRRRKDKGSKAEAAA
ncbi:UNVERIFIED_ORG: hypothetical protein LHJ69_14055 [Shinella sp. XGS7]|nr:hypothetical protein [Shinella sp. XGS7]